MEITGHNNLLENKYKKKRAVWYLTSTYDCSLSCRENRFWTISKRIANVIAPIAKPIINPSQNPNGPILVLLARIYPIGRPIIQNEIIAIIKVTLTSLYPRNVP